MKNIKFHTDYYYMSNYVNTQKASLASITTKKCNYAELCMESSKNDHDQL